MSGLDSERAAALGKIGAHVSHSRHNGHDLTAKARKIFLDSFDAVVDPDGVLLPEERRRRADHARKAHMARLALKSADVRRAAKAASNAA